MNQDFLEYISNMINSNNQFNMINSDPEDIIAKHYDIDKFISFVIKFLTEKTSKTNNTFSRVLFTESYPDTIPDEFDTVVSIMIGRRTFGGYGSPSEEKFGGRQRYRPMYRGHGSDIVNGGLVVYYSTFYDNSLEVYVHSHSSEKSRIVSTYIENIFIKYYHEMRNKVTTFHYEGRSHPQINSSGPKRMHSIPLSFYVRTEEMHYTREAEINLIQCEISGIKPVIKNND